MIITIDGPSGTGKSTAAKGVAQALGFNFFDTGAMYRATAWWLIQQGVDLNDQVAIAGHLPSFRYEIQGTGPTRKYFVHGTNVTDAIRTHEISAAASKIAVYPEVRTALVHIQREFGSRTNAVFEGRDMGTVVFPNAELKIYLTAKPEVQAKRRYLELGGKIPEEQILKDIVERDRNDSTRAISPLKPAPDAIFIDTSDLTIEQVIDAIVERAKPKQRWTYWLFRFCVRLYLLLFFRYKLYGLEHFRLGPAIIAANHASYLDPPIVAAACPEEIHSLARESLFQIPIIGRYIRHLNAHPITRDAADAATFKLILSLIKKGDKVLIFPEGERTPTGDMQPIERGLPFLVLKSHSRIQPLYLHGTFDAWPRTRKRPKLFGRIRCAFGSPIEWSEFESLEKKEAERAIIQRVTDSLNSLKKWIEDGAHGTPP
jgi:cytidylate kinase